MDLFQPKYNIQSIAGRVLFPGHSTTVINKKDNSIKVYYSIRAAARDIGVNHSTLYSYINKDKLLKGTYLVKVKPKVLRKPRVLRKPKSSI